MGHFYNSASEDMFTFGCDGAGPFNVAPGYSREFTGDLGMPAHAGFYHQALFQSTQPAVNAGTARLAIPRGTVCGLGHSRNDPYTLCAGYTIAMPNGCPAGWTKRTAPDADSGDHWFWCEYQDPFALCPPGVCRTNVPEGAVCGLSYTGKVDGICEGRVNAVNGCPAGWTRRGPRDEGAPSGVGLAWCERNPT
jgi:hypothetical protein